MKRKFDKSNVYTSQSKGLFRTRKLATKPFSWTFRPKGRIIHSRWRYNIIQSMSRKNWLFDLNVLQSGT